VSGGPGPCALLAAARHAVAVSAPACRPPWVRNCGLHTAPHCLRPLVAPPPPARLPPTVLSDEAARLGLGVTLFERLQHRHGADASEILTVQ
jgi:hypothetical protein